MRACQAQELVPCCQGKSSHKPTTSSLFGLLGPLRSSPLRLHAQPACCLCFQLTQGAPLRPAVGRAPLGQCQTRTKSGYAGAGVQASTSSGSVSPASEEQQQEQQQSGETQAGATRKTTPSAFFRDTSYDTRKASRFDFLGAQGANGAAKGAVKGAAADVEFPSKKGFLTKPSGAIPGAHGSAAETAGSSSGATGKHAAAAAKASASAASSTGAQTKRSKRKQAKQRLGLSPNDAQLLEAAVHACKLLERTMAISVQASACGRPLTRKETSMQDISDQHVRACFIRIMQRAQDLRNVGKNLPAAHFLC
jgi:hypothetical protein